ncbi:hypothetical protein KEM52_001167 [Ascosphaera acerosa]|nr:hypothetical protein KEM52_001167 [Ascosphaera acerosa]
MSASHVVVIDSTARRATVKVTPAKHLSEVLSEACAKLGVDPAQYGLKYKNKQLDLSLSIRLSGLTAGAKLELVQGSRSPSVVSVALQLPESEFKATTAPPPPNGRLVAQFPSDTTVWAVLRRFEAGVAGGGQARNFTARSVSTATLREHARRQEQGQGQAERRRSEQQHEAQARAQAGEQTALLYEMPVVNVMGRELGQFTDLQKTLGQLGLGNGSVLMRLSFRPSVPMEDAMRDISAYFQSEPADDQSAGSQQLSPQDIETPHEITADASASTQPVLDAQRQDTTMADEANAELHQSKSSTISDGARGAGPDATDAATRPTTVYAPPASSAPQAARFGYDENDYVPTTDLARAHQRHLQTASRPTRLASDAELEAQRQAAAASLAAVQSINVKIRLPDQSQIVTTFTRQDSGASLYEYVRSCLDASYRAERFHLSAFLQGGASRSSGHTARSAPPSQTTIADDSKLLLISGLGMTGRVLVTFSWDDAQALAAGARKRATPLLRPELRAAASQIQVSEPQDVQNDEEQPKKKDYGDVAKGGGSSGTKKIPKWLKLPGRK